MKGMLPIHCGHPPITTLKPLRAPSNSLMYGWRMRLFGWASRIFGNVTHPWGVYGNLKTSLRSSKLGQKWWNIHTYRRIEAMVHKVEMEATLVAGYLNKNPNVENSIFGQESQWINVIINLRASSTIPKTFRTLEQKVNLFHTYCEIGSKFCSHVIDDESRTNIVSELAAKKLHIATTLHPKPYMIQWFNSCEWMRVDK